MLLKTTGGACENEYLAPQNSSNVEFDVIVNNSSVGVAKGGESVQVSFPASPDGNNKIEFVYKKIGRSSGKRDFIATPGAELNSTLVYRYKSGGLFGTDEHFFEVDILTTKFGEIPTIESSKIEPDLIRREVHREIVNGEPGTKYTFSRKRTIERQIVLSESAKLELSIAASVGFGLVEATAKIKSTLSQKDTVLMRDGEETNQSVEVLFGNTGSATLLWVDYFKKGKAQYKSFGKIKGLEFEVLCSSELTVLRN